MKSFEERKAELCEVADVVSTDILSVPVPNTRIEMELIMAARMLMYRADSEHDEKGERYCAGVLLEEAEGFLSRAKKMVAAKTTA